MIRILALMIAMRIGEINGLTVPTVIWVCAAALLVLNTFLSIIKLSIEYKISEEEEDDR